MKYRLKWRHFWARIRHANREIRQDYFTIPKITTVVVKTNWTSGEFGIVTPKTDDNSSYRFHRSSQLFEIILRTSVKPID